MIRAEIICDSISPQGKRLTTFKLRYPWFIHGELMTHRMLSRNASSNRAIPLRKMLEEVRSDELRAEPVYWGAEQKGMEPGGELSDKGKMMGINQINSPKQQARAAWRMAAHSAASWAEQLGEIGLHKSLCNRLLMPFTHANVVVSATEWDNFFGLRLDAAADPTMRALAVAMWEEYNDLGVEPVLLQPGQWHLPFVDWDHKDLPHDCNVKVSVARCARVSYESFPEEGKPAHRSTVEEDIKLYDRLVGAQPMHASPAEHQATPDTKSRPSWDDEWDNEDEHGNFVGWRQYRKMLPGESCAPLPKEYAR